MIVSYVPVGGQWGQTGDPTRLWRDGRSSAWYHQSDCTGANSDLTAIAKKDVRHRSRLGLPPCCDRRRCRSRGMNETTTGVVVGTVMGCVPSVASVETRMRLLVRHLATSQMLHAFPYQFEPTQQPFRLAILQSIVVRFVVDVQTMFSTFCPLQLPKANTNRFQILDRPHIDATRLDANVGLGWMTRHDVDHQPREAVLATLLRPIEANIPSHRANVEKLVVRLVSTEEVAVLAVVVMMMMMKDLDSMVMTKIREPQPLRRRTARVWLVVVASGGGGGAGHLRHQTPARSPHRRLCRGRCRRSRRRPRGGEWGKRRPTSLSTLSLSAVVVVLSRRVRNVEEFWPDVGPIQHAVLPAPVLVEGRAGTIRFLANNRLAIVVPPRDGATPPPPAARCWPYGGGGAVDSVVVDADADAVAVVVVVVEAVENTVDTATFGVPPHRGPNWTRRTTE